MNQLRRDLDNTIGRFMDGEDERNKSLMTSTPTAAAAALAAARATLDAGTPGPHLAIDESNTSQPGEADWAIGNIALVYDGDDARKIALAVNSAEAAVALAEAGIGLRVIVAADEDDDHVRRVSRGADCDCWPCQFDAALARYVAALETT